MSEPVRWNGKIVGIIEDDGAFWKQVDETKHKLRSIPGWAQQNEILDLLDSKGVEFIVLYDGLTQLRYSATVAAYRGHGIPVPKGMGNQTVLPDAFWHVENTKQMTLT